MNRGWLEFIDNIEGPKSHNQIIKDVIGKIEGVIGHPVIFYVANFKTPFVNSIDETDKNIFDILTRNLNSDDRNLNLNEIDIVIHSPGGTAEAVEAIVNILRYRFKKIRYVVPNMAKSAATMLALSGDEILMDEKSELGPIDPQIALPLGSSREPRYVPAQAVVEGFNNAKEAILQNPRMLQVYAPLINKYELHLIELCKTVIGESQRMVKEWLKKYMFKEDNQQEKIDRIVEELSNFKKFGSHGRPISVDIAKELGLVIVDMRDAQYLKLRKLYHQLYELADVWLLKSQIAVKVFGNKAIGIRSIGVSKKKKT